VTFEQLLDFMQDLRTALASESAKNDAEEFSVLSLDDLSSSNLFHLFSLIYFFSQLLLKRIILKEGQLRVADHA